MMKNNHSELLFISFANDICLWVLIPSITFSTLLFLLGYAGHRQNFTIHDLLLETGNNPMPDCAPLAYKRTPKHPLP